MATSFNFACLIKFTLIVDSEVVPVKPLDCHELHSTRATQALVQHGLGTTHGTLFRKEFRCGSVTTPESVMSLSFESWTREKAA